MSEIVEIDIPITVECDEGSIEDAMWDVKDAIDEREGHSIGPIDIYEFSGFDDDFPDKIMNAVMEALKEAGEFENKEHFYSVVVTIVYGGSQLGFASRYFYGYQLPK